VIPGDMSGPAVFEALRAGRPHVYRPEGIE
jgi:hypothetical protein